MFSKTPGFSVRTSSLVYASQAVEDPQQPRGLSEPVDAWAR
jgi:hypothetical protein